jgi:hypothetical protein
LAPPAGAAPQPDFTIVALPDTQFYAKTNAAIFQAQADWIIANRTKLNIVYVAHLGDIVDDGDNQPYQWDAATNALYRLFVSGIPLGVVPGNHDHRGGTKLYDQFFGLGVFTNRPWYGGHYGADNRNHYDLFRGGDMDFVAVYTDFNRDKIDYAPLDVWANGVLRSNVNRRAIAVTHCILKTDGTDDPARTPTLYDSLKSNPNLFLMLCGHNHGEAYRAETNGNRVVHIALSDYQTEPNGGNGWLRLYQFSPTGNVVRVRTYSPTLNQYRTSSTSQFTIPYLMTPSR